jgi:hypothetical protein
MPGLLTTPGRPLRPFWLRQEEEGRIAAVRRSEERRASDSDFLLASRQPVVYWMMVVNYDRYGGGDAKSFPRDPLIFASDPLTIVG